MPPPQKVSLAQRIQELDRLSRDFDSEEDAPEPNARLLFYGDSGGGKSVLAIRVAQAITPPDQVIAYVDTSQGWVSLKNHSPELRKRVRLIKYEGWSQLGTIVEAIKWARKNPGKLPRWENVGCIIVDEWSTVVRTDLNLTTKVRAESPEGIKDGKDPFTPVWPDMRNSTHKASTMEKDILDLDIHVILTCHERTDKMRNGDTKTTMTLMKETREYIKEPLHLVGRVTADIVEGSSNSNTYKRRVQCQPTRLVDAKSRIGGLGVTEEFGPLISKIRQWLNEGSELVDESAEVTTQEEATVLAGALTPDD